MDSAYKTTSHGIAKLLQMKNLSDIKVLIYFMKVADANNEVHLTTYNRQIMTKELGSSGSNISRSLRNLINANIISGSSGEFKINELLFRRYP